MINKPDKTEIISGDSEFIKTYQSLGSELKDIIDGKAVFIEMDEVERRLESTIKKREDSLQR